MADTDEIKSRINIVDFIGKRVPLKKTGRNFKALCPFHNEKTPSFIVSPERQTFHCFGCGKGGDLFTFVMEYEHVDFPEALEELAELAGVKLTRRAADSPEARLKEQILAVNHLASEFYHFLLTKHKLGESARMYLKKRGITDKSIETFGLGYSPNNWHALTAFLKKKGYDETLLDRAGLTTRGHDMFRGRVMFTLRDHRGNVVGFSGRVLDPAVKESKYINTTETPVYIKGNVLYGLDVAKKAIQKENEAVVMEGELDVISCFQAGIGNGIAIKGSALTEAHVHLIRRYTDRLLFALDSDLAGDAAARRGIEIADREGLEMRVVKLPSGRDPDDVVRESPAAMKKAIKTAEPIYDYFIESATQRYDAKSAHGKRKIGDEILPILGKIDNPIVRGHYIKLLAKTLDTTEDHLEEQAQKLAKEQSYPTTRPTKPSEQDSPLTGEKIDVYVLGLMLQGKTKELYGEFAGKIDSKNLEHPAVRKIVEALALFLKKNATFSIKRFAATIPTELTPTLDEAFLWDLADISTDEARMQREWESAIRELERKIIKREIHAVTTRMKEQKDTRSDEKALTPLTERLKILEKRA